MDLLIDLRALLFLCRSLLLFLFFTLAVFVCLFLGFCLFLLLQFFDLSLFFLRKGDILLLLALLHSQSLSLLNLLWSSKLDLVEVVRELYESKLLHKRLVRRQVRHTPCRSAGVDHDSFPVDQSEQILVIQELGRQLKLKYSLAAAFGASRHLRGLVLMADPERVLDLALLLRVAQDLTRVLGRDDVEELVLGANFGRVVVIGVYELL